MSIGDSRPLSGAELRAVREFWGLPAVEFADLYQVAPSTFRRWERDGVSVRTNKFNFSTFEALRLARDVLADNV